MNAQGSLNNFVFRGLLTSEAVRDLQNTGIASAPSRIGRRKKGTRLICSCA